MTGPALAALLSHWRRRPFQLITLILGLSLATALWSGVQAINAEARKSYDEAASVMGGGGLEELVRADGERISLDTFVALRRAGWLVSPVVDGWLPTDRGRVRLLGVDPFTLPPGRAGAEIEPELFTRMTGDEGILLASPETAARLEGSGMPIQVAEALAAGLVLGDITRAEALLGETGFTRLLVLPDQPQAQPAFSDVAPGLVQEASETAQDLARLTDSFHLNLTAFGLLSFAVGLFIVNGAVGLAFEQRRPVFRTLRALGVPAGRLVILLITELLIFALIAGCLGVVIGYGIAALLLPDVAATLRGLYGATVEGTLTLSPLWWLSGIAIACLGTALAAAGGLWRVARMPPLHLPGPAPGRWSTPPPCIGSWEARRCVLPPRRLR